MIVLQATVLCDRCWKEIVLEDVGSEDMAWRIAVVNGWCDSDGGEQVCKECWVKYDEKLKLAQSVGAVDPHADASSD